MLETVVERLLSKNKTIAIMDTLTGGKLSYEMSGVEDYDKVLTFYAIPNERSIKVKFGVREITLNEYKENSIEVSRELARIAQAYTDSDFGIGLTGKINRRETKDPLPGEDVAFIAIYKKETNEMFVTNLSIKNATYEVKKEDVVSYIKDMLIKII